MYFAYPTQLGHVLGQLIDSLVTLPGHNVSKLNIHILGIVACIM